MDEDEKSTAGRQEIDTDDMPDGAPTALDASPARAREIAYVTARLAEAEDMLGKGVSARKTATALMKQHGVSRSTANRYVRAVYLRWQDESGKEDREHKRSHIRESAWHAYRAAMERQNMSLDKEGGEHYWASPDVGAAVRALDLLAHLDGVLEQARPIDGSTTFNVQLLHAYYFGGANAPEGAPALPATVVEMPDDREAG